MTYNIRIVDRAERSARITTGRQSPIATEKLYDFRGATADLPVIQLPIGMPVYRMENFRTFTDQRVVITKKGLKQNYFVQGQETESIQQEQHALLDALAKKASTSVTPVIDVLRKEGQREPLLITMTGIVVNGNRRLCAMRELYQEELEANVSSPRFAFVNCAVLPADTTANEIVEIEANLQAKPETRLDYDWIGDAKLISSLVAIYGNTTTVAAKHNRGDREVKNVLQALAEADLYLKEWKQAEGDYGRVSGDAEQFFKDLPKLLDGKSLELQQASRVLAWTLFDNREDIPGRLYDYNAAFGKLSAEVLERFAAEQGVSTESSSTDNKPNDTSESEPFSVDVDDTSETTTKVTYGPVIDLIKGGRDDKDLISSLIDTAQTSIEVAAGQKSKSAALKAAGQAHAKLVSVDLSKAGPDTIPAIKKQLEGISIICAKLLSEIEKR